MGNEQFRLLEIDSARLDMPLLESGGLHSTVSAIVSDQRQTLAFHITYVAHQEATWQLDSKQKLTIQAGQLGIIQPQSLHQGEWAVDHPNFHYWFYFNPRAAEAQRHTPFEADWLDEAHSRLLSLGQDVAQAAPGYAELCEKFHQHLSRGTANDYLWLRSLIPQIFLLSLESFSSETPTTRPRMDEVLRVVSERLLDWPKVGALAEYFAMDETQFQRFFKKSTGMSPWNYIIRARCRLACDLLQQSNVSITSLAHELGFSSSQHFSTVFRRFVGHTPGAFRSLHHKDQAAIPLH